MSATTQHEFHPDAESLNAFAERALNERERRELLEHLSVCGRCRQVVALAREAAETEVAAPGAKRRAPVRPRNWWKGWGLALAPAAALAATAAVAIYVHVQHVERSAEVANVESQRVPQNATSAPKASQPGQAEAAPAAGPPAAAAPEAKAEKLGRSGGAPRAREPVATAAMPEAGTMEGVEVVHETAPVSGAEEHGLARELAAPGGAQGGESGAQRTSEQVVVTTEAAEPEPQTVPASSFATVENRTPGAFSAARIANPIHLPNGRPAVSAARAGARILALDEAGALFLSEDLGGTWESVAKRWTGRAVAVRRQVAASGNREAAPAAEARTARKGADTGAAPAPPVVFEILNDQSQVWWSTDGKIWTAK
jgi:hypothetical protein